MKSNNPVTILKRFTTKKRIFVLASSRSDGEVSLVQGLGVRPIVRPNMTHFACLSKHNTTQLNKGWWNAL